MTTKAPHLSAVILLAGVLSAASGPARADVLPADAYRAANAALVEKAVLPGFETLRDAALRLDAETEGFCAEPGAAGLNAAQARYREALDAWMRVEHLTLGPTVLFMRNHRIAFWPDPRNTTGRQLGQAVAQRDGAAISAENFARGSVAIQGFPALERLLFEDGAGLAQASEDARFRCRFATAITGNLAGMAADLEREWRAFGPSLVQADGGAFETPRQATAELLQAFTAGLQRIADLKLAKPLGETVERGNPRLAENWRSARTLPNVVANLEALQAMYGLGPTEGLRALARASGLDPELDGLMEAGFAAALDTARSIDVPLADAIGLPEKRQALDKLREQVSALHGLAATRLASALDAPLGFNAMDGD
ncbi:imelysin family protein [Arenibaculum sp.]|uniref:imelysin family protein n=1 Tax=Arenibaculum sp. TaxID=2865862 RepID=UPI002E0D3B91|nr:imelysin family protein [Arenibaculum sp.]